MSVLTFAKHAPDSPDVAATQPALVTSLLNAISDVTTDRDVEQSLAAVAREMAGACNMSFCIISLLDQPKEHFVIAAVYSRKSKNIARLVGESYPLAEHAISVRVITKKSRRVIESISDLKLSEADRAYMRQRGAKCFVDFPLISGDEVIGALALADTEKERRFSKEELDLYQALADSVATAIHNIKLMEDLNQHATEMTMLRSIVLAANTSLDVEEMLQSSLGKVVEFTKAQGACIYIHMDNSTEDAPIASHGLSNVWLKQALLSKASGLIRKQVAETARTVTSDSLPKDTLTALWQGGKSASLTAIPLRAKKRVIGALCLLSDNPLEPRLVQGIGDSRR